MSETVLQCEEVCKQRITEAVDRERASLADVMQRQVCILVQYFTFFLRLYYNSTIVPHIWAPLCGQFQDPEMPALCFPTIADCLLYTTVPSVIGPSLLLLPVLGTVYPSVSAPSMSVFPAHLKAFLFRHSFPWLYWNFLVPALWQLSFLDT